jgi:hypothetical protein
VNQNARIRVQETSKAKVEIKLLIDRAQLIRRGKWEIMATKREAKKGPGYNTL